MKNNKGWAKIIETDKRDILLQRFFNDENDSESLKLTTHTNSCVVEVTVGGKTGPEAAETMDRMFAEATADTIHELIEMVFPDGGTDFLDAMDEPDETEGE